MPKPQMPGIEGPQLVVLRHAPIAEPGRLCGRTDVAARIDPRAIEPLAERLAGIVLRGSSPALRCQQTAQAVWGAVPALDPRLWEQNFGIHDGADYAALPDLGVLTNEALAAHRNEDGESFADLCTRVAPAVQAHAARAWEAQAPVVLVAHAGVARASIALATGAIPAALSFEISPLSLTRLRVGLMGVFSVIAVNEVCA